MAVHGYADGRRCPTDVCGAVCCKSSSYHPARSAPCEHLRGDLLCQEHVDGGLACKPYGCATFPQTQADIDTINRQAERMGFVERCQLRVE